VALSDKREDWVLPEETPEKGVFYPGALLVGEHDEKLVVARRLIGCAKDRLSAKHHSETDFIVEVEAAGGKPVRYRAHCEMGMSGKIWMFRRILAAIPELNALLPGTLSALLLTEKLNQGGLVVIAGRPGQGKSTTSASVISARLKKFGGLCISTEDPPELPLDGYHGAGLCIQRERINPDPKQTEWQARSALRAFPVGIPGILYFGEVRDKGITTTLLEAALNGLLILTTLHASSPIDAIARLVKLSGEAAEARHIIAASLKLVLHQQLKNGTTLNARPLVVNDAGIQAKIRDDKLTALKDDLQTQQNRLNSGLTVW